MADWSPAVTVENPCKNCRLRAGLQPVHLFSQRDSAPSPTTHTLRSGAPGTSRTPAFAKPERARTASLSFTKARWASRRPSFPQGAPFLLRCPGWAVQGTVPSWDHQRPTSLLPHSATDPLTLRSSRCARLALQHPALHLQPHPPPPHTTPPCRLHRSPRGSPRHTRCGLGTAQDPGFREAGVP